MQLQMIRILFMAFLCNVYCAIGQAKIHLVNQSEINNTFLQNQDTLSNRILHFWATWCAPCVKELKELDAASEQLQGLERVQFISLDFKKDTSKVRFFIKDKPWMRLVYLMDAPNYNSWIDWFSESWSGSIPCTIVYRKGAPAKVYEKNLNMEQWKNILRE